MGFVTKNESLVSHRDHLLMVLVFCVGQLCFVCFEKRQNWMKMSLFFLLVFLLRTGKEALT